MKKIILAALVALGAALPSLAQATPIAPSAQMSQQSAELNGLRTQVQMMRHDEVRGRGRMHEGRGMHERRRMHHRGMHDCRTITMRERRPGGGWVMRKIRRCR